MGKCLGSWLQLQGRRCMAEGSTPCALPISPPTPVVCRTSPPQGYLLGVVLKPDVPACAALVSVVGGVMVSDDADRLLMARGAVGAPTAGR